MLNRFQLVTFGLLCLMASALFVRGLPPAQAVLLQGGVSQEARPEPATLTVVAAGTGQPLYHAKVQWPHLGRQLTGQAMVSLPPSCNNAKGCLVAVSAEGYQPQTLWLTTQAAQAHTLALTPEQRSITWSDDTFRLGDGAYSWQSAGANRLVEQASQAVPRRQITLTLPKAVVQQAQKQPTLWLELGEVFGLDTADAYRAGQTQAPVAASPLRVSLGQQLMGEVLLNQRQKRLAIPSAWVLQAGERVTLTLEAGYQSKASGEVDYDDCSVVFVRWAW